MLILFDHGTPRGLASALPGHSKRLHILKPLLNEWITLNIKLFRYWDDVGVRRASLGERAGRLPSIRRTAAG